MEENQNKFIVYVDTSYLTRMGRDEKPDWNRLLEYAKKCTEHLDTRPQLEIHISEIALSEYRTKMIDELCSTIERTKGSMKDLEKEWQKNDIAKNIDYPLPKSMDIFPAREKIDFVADQFIKNLMDGGVKKINMQEHHKESVWKKYFNWEPPFNCWAVTERHDQKVRDKRRIHIPDAWILEAALDVKQKMLVLCGDENLASALEADGHTRFKEAKHILSVLFPSEQPKPNIGVSDEVQAGLDSQSPLDVLLSKTFNDNAKNIALRLLGFVEPLGMPTHNLLIETVESKGFDRKQIEACVVQLSDKSKPYIVDTGSHYIAGDKEICAEAADRLTQEIIEMLERAQ